MGSQPSLALGIVGCGRISRGRMLPALKEVGDLELRAVLEPDAAARATIGADVGNATVTDSIEEFYGAGLDAVYIATPNVSHAPLTVDALKRGVAVLVEKPCAESVQGADAMAVASRNSGRPLLVAYMSKFNRHNRMAEDRVRNGDIGSLLAMNAAFGCSRPAGADWRFLRQPSGFGVLSDLGIYPVTTALDLFDRVPVRCSATGYPGRDVESSIRILSGTVEFADGGRLTLTASDARNGCHYTLVGTDGAIEVTDTWAQDGRGKLLLWNGRGPRELSCEVVNPYVEELRVLVRCLRGAPVPSELGIERACLDVRVLAALAESADKHGCSVNVPDLP